MILIYYDFSAIFFTPAVVLYFVDDEYDVGVVCRISWLFLNVDFDFLKEKKHVN